MVLATSRKPDSAEVDAQPATVPMRAAATTLAPDTFQTMLALRQCRPTGYLLDLVVCQRTFKQVLYRAGNAVTRL
jgi:hypothetical protein